MELSNETNANKGGISKNSKFSNPIGTYLGVPIDSTL